MNNYTLFRSRNSRWMYVSFVLALLILPVAGPTDHEAEASAPSLPGTTVTAGYLTTRPPDHSTTQLPDHPTTRVPIYRGRNLYNGRPQWDIVTVLMPVGAAQRALEARAWSEDREAERGETAPLAAAASTVSGTVYEPDSVTPLPDAFVEIYDTDSDPVGSDTADSNGDYTITGVPAGDYSLIAYPPTPTLAASVPITFTADGTTLIAIDVSVTTINVHGQVLDPTSTQVITDSGVLVYNGDLSLQRTAGVDGSGNFRIGGLLTDTYTIEARPGESGYTPSYTATFVITDVAIPVDVGTLLLTTPEVTGTVRYPSDGVASDASVWVHNADWSVSEVALTNENGIFRLDRLPSGAYTLEAFPPTGAPYAGSEPQTVILSQGSTIGVGDVSLRTPQVQGTVKDPASAIVEGAWVQLYLPGTDLSASTTTDSFGRFYLGGLPEGIYTLEAFPPLGSPYTPSFPQAVTVQTGGDPEIGDVALTTPQVQGTVCDPDSALVADAYVEATGADGYTQRGGVTNASGFYRIGGLPAGDYTLIAYPPDGADMAASTPAAATLDTTPVTRNLQLNAINIRGQITDPGGDPLEEAGVEVYNDDFSVNVSTGSDSSGHYKIGGLPDGIYTLEIFAPWGSGGMLSPGPVTVTVAASTPITVDRQFAAAPKPVVGAVQLSSGGVVSNVVVNALGRGFSAWATTSTATDGSYGLDLTPGNWELSIAAPEGTVPNWAYDQPPKLLSFLPLTDTSAVTATVVFTVTATNANVIGQMQEPGGLLPAPESVYVELRTSEGFGNGQVVEDGSFNIPVVAGVYRVLVHSTDPELSGPAIAPISVAEGETLNLGTLTLRERDVTIQGHVTRASDGAGVAGITVDAWTTGGGAWWSTTTAADGSYSLAVITGTWDIGLTPPISSTYIVASQPGRVVITQTGTASGLDGLLRATDAEVAGQLVDSDGKVLTELNGWSYGHLVTETVPTFGGSVVNGRFNWRLASGQYRVGVWLAPGAAYTVLGEVLTNISPGETKSVAITVAPQDARLTGLFQGPAGQASGTMSPQSIRPVQPDGIVYATSGMLGAWQETTINPDGTYELPVAEGCWNVGYRLEDEEYVSNPYPDTRVCISSNQTIRLDWTVVEANAHILATIHDPDDLPLPDAWVWAARPPAQSAITFNPGESTAVAGHAQVRVPEGTYSVGAGVPPEWGYLPPTAETVTTTASASAQVTLTFRASDAAIDGRLTLNDVAGQPAFYQASVWAWADSGTYATTATRYDGTYHLPVTGDDVWHVGAVYEYHDQGLVYRTQQTSIVKVGIGETRTLNMRLYLDPTPLPASVSYKINPKKMTVITLEDGTKITIPAGALSTKEKVSLIITPIASGLAHSINAQPFGFGYAMFAFDKHGQIVDTFNQNVLITFGYTDERLDYFGVSESDLVPAYFSTTSNCWAYPKSYSIDTANNLITLEIDHFTTFALVSTEVQPKTSQIYLPLVLKNFTGGSTIYLPLVVRGS